MVRLFISTLIISGIVTSCQVNVDSQFLGPNRNGIYPEAGLLDRWPDEGPELIWKFDSLGWGHSSPAVTKDKIYITGLIDSLGYLFCLNHDGELLWKESYGREWDVNYVGTRATPTIVGNLLYLMTSYGELFCFDTRKKVKIWKKLMGDDFGGDSLKYGRSESILIKGDQLFCVPGGHEFNIISLNRHSGELVWSSSGLGEASTYSSPILINHNDREILITVTAHSIFGLNATTGHVLWQVSFDPGWVGHTNTPVYEDGVLYMASEARGDKNQGGFIALELNGDGSSAKMLWNNSQMRNVMSGMMVKKGCLFTSTYREPNWLCLDALTGDTLYTWTGYPYGNITYADNLFYILSSEGEVLLCDGSREAFNTISSFRLDLKFLNPWAPLWAFPVIKDKRFYIRHKSQLFVFDIERIET